MIGKEIESKIKCAISRQETLENIILISGLKHIDITEFSGYDRFYSRADDPQMHTVFGRYRNDQAKEELTVKVRNHSDNIVDRLEINLKLARHENDHQAIDAFMAALGYKFSYALPKHGFYVRLQDVTISRYQVYSDTYLEIEVNEDYSEDMGTNLELLAKYEEGFQIYPADRINQSLAEIYSTKAEYALVQRDIDRWRKLLNSKAEILIADPNVSEEVLGAINLYLRRNFGLKISRLYDGSAEVTAVDII